MDPNAGPSRTSAPCIHQTDRARNLVAKHGPEWEAQLSPHTYGFRPGRSCHDAIGALFTAIRFRPQYALKIDIAKCFDRINHQALLAKVQAPPLIRRQLKAWLQAGILEDEHLTPTTAGTPQGGSCSPLLALIALHGMEEAIAQVYPRARVIPKPMMAWCYTKIARSLTMPRAAKTGWPRWD